MNKDKQTLSEGELSFEIRTIEWLAEHRAWLDEPRKYPYFQIVWVMGGAGEYCIDMEKYPIGENRFYFLPAGRMQQLLPSGVVSGYVLSFDADFLYLSSAGPGQELYKELLTDFSRVTMLHLANKRAEELLTHILANMTREFSDCQSLRLELLSGLLNIFLIYLRREAMPVQHEPVRSKKHDLFNNFYSKVQTDFLTKRLVAEYASELSVTPNYLSDVVKRVTGYSASYHIQQRMVLEAKRMAVYSDANMKLIAYKLGFDDLSHFSKFFKNAAGVNFSEFRNRSRHQTT